MVSLLDDTRKIPISRLGEHLGIAGTAELAGCHHALDSPTAQTRCTALRRAAAPLRSAVARLGRPVRAELRDRPASQHAEQHPLHRPQLHPQAVADCQPRHAGLDPRCRLGPGAQAARP